MGKQKQILSLQDLGEGGTLLTFGAAKVWKAFSSHLLMEKGVTTPGLLTQEYVKIYIETRLNAYVQKRCAAERF